jgi:hypothetical protein
VIDMVPPGVRLGIVRGISYGLFGKPDEFVPQLRELGAATTNESCVRHSSKYGHFKRRMRLGQSCWWRRQGRAMAANRRFAATTVAKVSA